MIIKSHNFWGKCHDCGKDFQTLSGISLGYGIRLLVSQKNRLPAILICDHDPAFSEIWEMVKKILFLQELFDGQIAVRFNNIFGKICDPAPDNSLYDMSGKEYCPQCGSSNVGYGPIDPPVFQEVDAPIVTHKKWDKLDVDQKMSLVKSLLEANP